MRSIAIPALIALAAGGCELAQGQYRRERELGGDPPIAVQAVPSEAPAGRVRVDVVGATQVGFPILGTVTLVRVQLRIANDRDEQPWIVDERFQRIEVPGHGRFAALPAGEPISSVARRTERTLDLRFSLPVAIDDAPVLDVRWQLTTGTRIVGETARFRR
jgi:hypothetical protein